MTALRGRSHVRLLVDMSRLMKRRHDPHCISIATFAIIIFLVLAYATAQEDVRDDVRGNGRSAADTLLKANRQATRMLLVPKVRVVFTENLYKRQLYGLNMKQGTAIATFNSGNIVWTYGAEHLLDPALSELVSIKSYMPEQGPAQVLMIPTANMLVDEELYPKLEGLYRLFEKFMQQVPAPVFMVGVGLQRDYPSGLSMGSTHARTTQFNVSTYVIKQSQVTFFQEIKDSGGVVSVRGKLTEAVSLANRLPPPEVLGCPSLFINHNLNLGALLHAKWNKVLQQRDPRSLRLAVGLPHVPMLGGTGPLSAASGTLIQWIADNIFKVFPMSFAVFQTPLDAGITMQKLRTYGVNLTPSRTKYFYDAEQWIEGIRNSADLLFGFRIHGTMAGLAAEVPGIIISTDYRIQELAEQMALPTATLHDPLFDMKPFDLYKVMTMVGFNGSRFDERRRQLAGEYARVFDRLGIPLHLGIKRIADELRVQRTVSGI